MPGWPGAWETYLELAIEPLVRVVPAGLLRGQGHEVGWGNRERELAGRAIDAAA